MRSGTGVKICGLTNGGDAEVADAAGADYLGAVVSAGFGRSVPEAELEYVFGESRATRVIVTVNEPAPRAAELAAAVGASVIQLHGEESRAEVEAVRALGPWRLWKAVRARSTDDITRVAEEVGDLVDGFVVEGWQRGIVGGGGVSLSLGPDEVRACVPRELRFVLAGGLTPENVADAVARFRPNVVDVSSGVERSLGLKDPERVRRFVHEARRAANTTDRTRIE
ncbi:MAG: phosphoribosylanthranilate isomerase [Gemmatimonadota bacterium]